MKPSRSLVLSCLSFLLAAAAIDGRSILQKPMFYSNAATNATGQSLFWSIDLGQPLCTLSRKFPGEPEQKITAQIYLYFLSNGYIEGNGYCNKGRIDCIPSMKIKTDSILRDLALDSIDCIYENGLTVRTTSGIIGQFIIDIEGQQIVADRFLLNDYKMVGTGEEKELKSCGDDIPLAAISFSKEGIAWARKTMALETPPDTVKSPGRH